MRYTPADHKIEALADQQHGVFSRRQAFRLGATDRLVNRRLGERYWLRPEPGVYVLASSEGTWRQRCKVAELSVDGAALAGSSAAALHDLAGFRPAPPELVVPANANCRLSVALCHRYAGARLTTVDGFRVTTIPQTLFDVAITESPWKVERALDGALVEGRVTIEQLDERFEFYAGRHRRGVPVLAALLEERRADGWAPPESGLEVRLHDLLARATSRPRVVRQASFPWWSAQPGRVDVLLPDHRLIVEADGRRWHTRVKDFDRDRWRDNQATANGYGVLRFTWVHLHDFAAESLQTLEQAIRLAA